MKAKGNADVELAVDAHCLLGESPVWDPRSRKLVWVRHPSRHASELVPEHFNK